MTITNDEFRSTINTLELEMTKASEVRQAHSDAIFRERITAISGAVDCGSECCNTKSVFQTCSAANCTCSVH